MWKLLKRFGANQDTKDALIVICTAMAESEVRKIQDGLSSGDVDLLMAKPITNEKIARLLSLSAAKRVL